MRLVTGALQQNEEAVDDEHLAVQWAEATLLITARSPADIHRLARRIHAASVRAAYPFVHVQASALPARTTRLRNTCARLLNAARGGSLLLADVEELSPMVQARLIETLSDLQGARRPSANVRLIAGTTASLPDRMAEGTFSPLLFYRLNVIHIVVADAAAQRPLPSETVTQAV